MISVQPRIELVFVSWPLNFLPYDFAGPGNADFLVGQVQACLQGPSDQTEDTEVHSAIFWRMAGWFLATRHLSHSPMPLKICLAMDVSPKSYYD